MTNDELFRHLSEMAADIGFVMGVVEALVLYESDTIKDHISSLKAIHEHADNVYVRVATIAEDLGRENETP